jgi:two-component system, OmpR family, response regulator CpxR
MSVVAILSAKGCPENAIISQLSEKSSYKVLSDKEIYEYIYHKYSIPESKLYKAFFSTGALIFTSQTEIKRLINLYKLSVLEELIKDKIIYKGFGTLLLPDNAKHIFKVCIGAELKYRIQNLSKEMNISENEAESKIRNDDKSLFKFAQALKLKSPYQSDIYDMTISVDKLNIDDVINRIFLHFFDGFLETGEEDMEFLKDEILATKVLDILLSNKHDVDVTAESGKVKVFLKKYKIRMENYIEKIKDLVLKAEGVKNVEVTFGKDIQIPSPSMPFDIKRREKVLLVDDEVEFVDTLSERLMSRNIMTSVAYSGEEALESLNKELPDVIILDLKMPGIDGIEVLRKVKKEHPETEVIILTGHGSEKEKILSYELGAFAYLEKPVNIDILSETMKKAYEKINLAKKSSIR